MISNIERTAIKLAIQNMSEYDKERALFYAIVLHDFICKNSGDNADWPLQISSSDKDVIIQFHKLMMGFRQVLKPKNNEQ